MILKKQYNQQKNKNSQKTKSFSKNKLNKIYKSHGNKIQKYMNN